MFSVNEQLMRGFHFLDTFLEILSSFQFLCDSIRQILNYSVKKLFCPLGSERGKKPIRLQTD